MDVYEEIVAGLERGDRLVLATIVSSSGSTPVPPGAKMLVRGLASVPVGTIGGGCIEADIQEEARKLLESGGISLIRRFTLTEDDIESGMLCGGTIDVLVESLTGEEKEVYSGLVSRRDSGGDAAVVTVIGPVQAKRAKFLVSFGASGVDEADLRMLGRVAITLPPAFRETLLGGLGRQAVMRIPYAEGEFIIEPVPGLQDLIIFGGGHVSRYVSRSAAMAGFRVTVVDDRPEYANAERFPEAYRTLAAGFDSSWDRIEVKPSSFIVIVTRGHKFDERVLERAVRTPARYIGMIGSRRKVTSTYAHLVERGVPRELLRSVRAPIGLDIGAVTAEEIGISITAELVAVRRGGTAVSAAKSRTVAEFFQEGGA